MLNLDDFSLEGFINQILQSSIEDIPPLVEMERVGLEILPPEDWADN
jgi:hypothetical protein